MTSQEISTIVNRVLETLIEDNYIGQGSYAKAQERLFALMDANPTYTDASLLAYCIERIKATTRTPEQFTAAEKEANRRASEAFEREQRKKPYQPVGTCEKCGGSGIFWLKGPSEDGKAPQLIPGKCYPCAGKGHMTEADVKRTTNYFRYFYTVRA